MSVQLATTLPLWIALLLLSLVTLHSWALYRRHPASRRLQTLLLTARVSSLALLTLAILEPIISNVTEFEQPATAAVIVDTSASMDVVDPWNNQQLIDIGQQLGRINPVPELTSLDTLADEVAALQLVANTTIEPDRLTALRKTLRRSQAIAENLGRSQWFTAATSLPFAARRSALLQQIERCQVTALRGTDRQITLREALHALTQEVAMCHSAAVAAVVTHPDFAPIVRELRRMNRRDLAVAMLQSGTPSLLASLNEQGRVVLFGLDEPAQPVHIEDILHHREPSTRLGSIVIDVLHSLKDEPLSAIIVVTDGNLNSGKALRDVAPLVQATGARFLACGVGLTTPPPDTGIIAVNQPRSVFAGNAIPIEVQVRRNGFEQLSVDVELIRNGRVVQTCTITPEDEPLATFRVVEETAGRYRYRLRLPPQPGESVRANNEAEVVLDVLGDAVTVLILDNLPRWETRYLDLILRDDGRIKHSLQYLGARNRQDRPRLNLENIDVVVLGDIDPRQFHAEEIEQFRHFVVDLGGTLLALAGPNHMPAAWELTPIGRLLPIRSGNATSLPESGHRKLPELRLRPLADFTGSELIQLAPTARRSRDRWLQLPPVAWTWDSAQASANAERVVETGEGIPVITAANVGNGRAIFIGSDEFWRWRYRSNGDPHRRLWSQLLLTGTRSEWMAGGPHVRLATSQASFTPGEVILVRARLFDQQQQRLSAATASVRVLDQDREQVAAAPLKPLDERTNEYQARLEGLPAGTYSIRTSILGIDDQDILAELSIDVRDEPTAEYDALALNESALRSVADTYCSVVELAGLVDSVPPRTLTRTHREDKELWGIPAYFLIILLLLGVEWQMRKFARLA